MDLKVLFVYPSKPLQETRLKTYNSWLKLGARLEVLFAYTDEHSISLINKVFNKLKLPKDSCRLNARIIESSLSFRPDLVFIVKGVLVKPQTVKWLKKRNIKIVSWSNDDMYAWHNRSWWYTWSLKYYDLVVTQKSYNCNEDELPSLGAKVLFQDKAIDPDINYPYSNCTESSFSHDVVFVGTKEDDRYEYSIPDQYIRLNIVPVFSGISRI